MKAVFALVTVLAGFALASPGAEPEKRQCLANGSACRADGSLVSVYHAGSERGREREGIRF
ncbi:hypothetical protein CP533_0689 [Ophiocordyceps camponoti-saundersi (nom. inval.)]|nr:hypothetical protein CP533_0689 [Ophiocordyceps camponoti-saundersi (nom. inval.)]